MNWDWNQLLQWPTVETPMDIWLTQLFIIVLCTVSINFILMRSIDVAERLIGKTDTLWDDALLEAARIPVRLVFWVIGLSVSMELLQAVSAEENTLFEFVPQARRIAFIIIIAMFLNRFVSYTEKT